MVLALTVLIVSRRHRKFHREFKTSGMSQSESVAKICVPKNRLDIFSYVVYPKAIRDIRHFFYFLVRRPVYLKLENLYRKVYTDGSY